ncbi:MAG TPA: cellulase family glycosylhydrolase [Mycobacteriales bacterium]|nr:cellulase family glycosylhydrolase [Mycobacteriales bacterium]
MRRLRLLAIVAAGAVLAAMPWSSAAGHAKHHAATSGTSGRPLEFLHVGAMGSDGLPQIVDQAGRSVLLRGVNVDGLVDYWRPDLRPPYPTGPSAYRHGRCPPDDPTVEGVPICRFDFRQMRPLGYDNIRLNVSWSLLEPRPGHIDRHYVARIAQVVHWAKRQGIWVVIDLHQDAWSKYVYTKPGEKCLPLTSPTRGYDGAPRWASPSRLPACTIHDTRELDLAVQADAQDFWLDRPAPDGEGLQEHYAHVVAVLAKRFRHDPAVAGYDLMNEPEFGLLPGVDNTAELLPFYAKVARTVRRDVPGFRQLLFFEPSLERNTTGLRSFFTKWASVSAYRNAVYAPHVYTKVFTLGAVTGLPDIATFNSDYGAVVADARALGVPLWIGEFGGPPQGDKTVLAQHYAQQEARRIGGTLWLWKENANDSVANTFWGVYGPPFTGASVRGVRQPQRVRRTSRVYPIVTAGRLLTAVSDPYAGTARVVASSPRVRTGDRRHGTLVSVPKVFRGRIVVRGASHRVRNRSGAREVWLFPRGGRYSLRVVPS